MSYNLALADRVREALICHTDNLEEKEMFSGICFMVNGKMCICVSNYELMCRIGPDNLEAALEHGRGNARQMTMKERVMKDYVLISEEGFRTKSDFDYWVGLALEFNPKAKASKKNRA